ncbi:hypothetical protein SLS60_011565 [Paraconiothyrium brasiliense]|uniref:Peptidase S8/S53 domain-containing protein n=1 Tax=Paraconiothyrium brasiliense TaxID=300254 RepID=A0ABR3QIT1_9PLEO
MADIATPLKQLSEGFQAGNSTDVSARNTLEHARNYEETAFAIGRALTTMNTVLLLSSEPNNYNYWRSTQPLALVGRRQNATFELDALTLSARYGGPHIVPKAEPGSVAEKTAWFMSFEQCQSFVQERRGEEFKYKRVKVAVLDTGLDPGLRNTVEDYIDFTDADWRTKQHRPVDNAGHGTFVKDLLHQVAPNARIYVGRVMRDDCRRREDDTDEGFDTEEEDTDEGFAAEEGDDVELQGDTDAIGDAIRHALDDEQWDVDIISMSFSTGRGYKPESVVRAIDLCTKRPILLFAAACNDGARGTPTIGYPASHFGNVFCIHSTDEGGDPSRFTPPPKPSTDNFSMVGEGLIAAYPPHLLDLDPSYDVQAEGMPQVSMDGTSMATPIVAGIAALVIEFWRQYEDLFEDHTFPEGEVATVETHGGMHAILKFMSSDDQKSGYSWIKPWELFKTGRSPEHVAVLMVYALSKRLK